MTDGHGVSAEAPHDHHSRRLLSEVEAGNGVSQRSLAQRTGIALGLTNLLIKRLVRKGWIRMIHVQPNRVKYLITPAGAAEKARMSAAYLTASMRFYAEARDRILSRFEQLSEEWPVTESPKRIVFFGTDAVAEVGFVCLHSSDLTLVGVVGLEKDRRFCGMQVAPLSALQPRKLGSVGFDKLVVMAFEPNEEFRQHVNSRGIPEADVVWL